MQTPDLKNINTIINHIRANAKFAEMLELRTLIRDYEDQRAYFVSLEPKKVVVRPDIVAALTKALDPPDLRGVDKRTIDALVNYLCNQMFDRERILKNAIIQKAGELDLLTNVLI